MSTNGDVQARVQAKVLIVCVCAHARLVAQVACLQLQKLLALTQQSASSSALPSAQTPAKEVPPSNSSGYSTRGYVPPSVQQRRWAPGSRALPQRKRSDGSSSLTSANWPVQAQSHNAPNNYITTPLKQYSEPAASPQAPARQEKALPVPQPHCPAKPDQIGPLIGKPQRGTPASTPYKQNKPTAPGSFAARAGSSSAFSGGDSLGSGKHTEELDTTQSTAHSSNGVPHSPSVHGVDPAQPSASVPLLSGTLRERAALTSHRYYLAQSGPWAANTAFVTENHAASRRFGDRSAYLGHRTVSPDSVPADSTPRRPQGNAATGAVAPREGPEGGFGGANSSAQSMATPAWARATAQTASSVQTWTGRSTYTASPTPQGRNLGGNFLQPAPEPGSATAGTSDHSALGALHGDSGGSLGHLHRTGHTPLAHHMHNLSPEHRLRDDQVRAAMAVVTGVAASTSRPGHVYVASSTPREATWGPSASAYSASTTPTLAALHNSPSAAPGSVGIVGNSAKASLLAMRTADAMLLQQKAASQDTSGAGGGRSEATHHEGSHLFRSFSHRVPPSLQHVATAAAAASSAVHARSPARSATPTSKPHDSPIAQQEHIQPSSSGMRGVQATVGLTVLGPSPKRASARQVAAQTTPPPLRGGTPIAPQHTASSPGGDSTASAKSAAPPLRAVESVDAPRQDSPPPNAGGGAADSSAPHAGTGTRVIKLPSAATSTPSAMPAGVFHPSMRFAPSAEEAKAQPVHQAAAASLQQYASAPSKSPRPSGTMTAEQISAMLDAASARVLTLQKHVTPPTSRSNTPPASGTTTSSVSPQSYSGQLGAWQSAGDAVAAAGMGQYSTQSAVSGGRQQLAVPTSSSTPGRVTFQDEAAGNTNSTALLKERLAALRGHLDSL